MRTKQKCLGLLLSATIFCFILATAHAQTMPPPPTLCPIEPPPETKCFDACDNDGDGPLDCADPDCACPPPDGGGIPPPPPSDSVMSPPSAESCAPAPTSSLIVNVKDEGAKGDGVTDDTAAIQAAVDKVAETGGTALVPEGTYMIDAVTSIYLKSHMTFRMTSTTILKAIPNSKESYSILYMSGVSNVTVIGGTVMGERDQHTGTTGEWGMGIRLFEASNVVVEGVTAKDTWGDGFYIGDASKNATFCSVVADNNRRNGLSGVSVDGLVVKNSVFINTNGALPEAGIDLEPDADGIVNNVLIQRSLFTNNRGKWGALLLTGPAPNSAVTNVTVDGNTITDNYGPGIGIYNSTSGNTITNNRVKNNGHDENSWHDGIYLAQEATDTVIVGNTVAGNAGSGISVAYAANNSTVTGNTVTDNAGNGISVTYKATNTTIIGNTVTGNTGHGISDEVGGNTIYGNTVINNTLDSAE